MVKSEGHLSTLSIKLINFGNKKLSSIKFITVKRSSENCHTLVYQVQERFQ